MPLMSGTVAVRRYRVDGDPPDHDDCIARLREHAFAEPPKSKSGVTSGWVGLKGLHDTDFPYEDTSLNQYLVFRLRVDTKRLPAALFRSLLDLRVRAWLQETGRERVPAAVKREMREQLELELLPNHLPSVAGYDAAWDTQQGLVRLFHTSKVVDELFRGLFIKTFEVDIHPISPLRVLREAQGGEGLLERANASGALQYGAGR